MSYLGKIKAYLLTFMSPLYRFYLLMRGCHVGREFIAMGRPGINRKRGSIIRLGNNVTLCSSGVANPVAEGGRCRLATLSKDAELSLHNHVGISSTIICCADRIEIGEGTIIGGGCMIIDTDFHYKQPDGTWGTDPISVSKSISIGKNCFIGARSIILKGVHISDGAVIGAGSIVTKDIPANSVAAGNPAKVISQPDYV